MTPNGQMTRDDFSDALGWMYAVLNGDDVAKSTLAGACDPPGMVEAMATLFAGLILISTHGKPLTYLDFVRDHLDEMLEQAAHREAVPFLRSPSPGTPLRGAHAAALAAPQGQRPSPRLRHGVGQAQPTSPQAPAVLLRRAPDDAVRGAADR